MGPGKMTDMILCTRNVTGTRNGTRTNDRYDIMHQECDWDQEWNQDKWLPSHFSPYLVCMCSNLNLSHSHCQCEQFSIILFPVPFKFCLNKPIFIIQTFQVRIYLKTACCSSLDNVECSGMILNLKI